MRLPGSVLLLLLAPLVAMPAAAETYRVDDSASVVQSGRVAMKWDGPLQRGAVASGVTGMMTVQVSLDLSPWRGRTGRIHLTLPAQPSGPLTATWTSRGRLLPGVLRAGERSLVYAGPIQDARLEDTLRFVLQTDGRRMQRDESLEFSFEIDLETP